MHVFFATLAKALEGRRVASGRREGRIHFSVGALADEVVEVTLTRAGCRVGPPVGTADLTVYTDEPMLTEMLTTGFSVRALRYAGASELLEELSNFLTPGFGPLQAWVRGR